MKPSVWQTADMASKWIVADAVEYVSGWGLRDYREIMLTHAALTALWSSAEHDDDTEGTGEYQSEVDKLRDSFSPNYEEALPDDVRLELEADINGFVDMAWPYLNADDIGPDQAGHDFHLTRNRNGTGFWDRGYEHGDALTALAHTFGTFDLTVTGHGEQIHVYGSHS